MKKRILLLVLSMCIYTVQAQVGINTTAPQATLEIKAIKGETADGLLVPRLTTDEVKAMENKVGDAQEALMVYVTDATAGQTGKYVNINTPGFYYYDKNGSKWEPLGKSSQLNVSSGNVWVPFDQINKRPDREVITGTKGSFYKDVINNRWIYVGQGVQMSFQRSDRAYRYMGSNYSDAVFGDGNMPTNTLTPSGNLQNIQTTTYVKLSDLVNKNEATGWAGLEFDVDVSLFKPVSQLWLYDE